MLFTPTHCKKSLFFYLMTIYSIDGKYYARTTMTFNTAISITGDVLDTSFCALVVHKRLRPIRTKAFTAPILISHRVT